ncbi:MAG: radical SAM protein [Verrucomicrobia bacterium]|jgi:DNA repair photolyase|nr:radical SAM protein [Verrucomicrobiota bacterium]MBT7069032.1 radical SAM protein [Verrucomicrobiota bacterium]MBT7699723.1 radical SAM protein [Verrucomicrobiota bacterium]
MNNTDQPAAAHGTGEWAASNINVQAGCEHDCRYCYNKRMAIQFGRATPKSWASPVPNNAAINKDYQRRDGTLMFPSSHDITPVNIEACLIVLRKLLSAGNKVLIVSKPHLECIQRICDELVEYKAQILFRFTIGSADDSVLKLWEPDAPAFAERVACLRRVHELGFETSVSCEPMLDANIDDVITAVEPHVTDAIWLGRANRLRHTLAMTCPGDAEMRRRADKLISTWDNPAVKALYERYKHNPMIRWKDSVKKVVGLVRPAEKGLDI